jgi:hypothetical protein
VLVEIAEELQREILERERRPVEELEHVGALVELLERRDVGMLEGRVGTRDDLPQHGRPDVGRETAGKTRSTARRSPAGQSAKSPAKSGSVSGRNKPPSGASPVATASEKPSGGSLPAGGDEAHSSDV